MDSIKPCRRCSEASSQRCDASVLCGPLTPVVYVPIPVAITGSCKNCGKACSYCQDLGSDQSPKYVEEEANHNLIQYRYLSDKESSVNEKEELDCVCNAEKRACNSAQEQSDRDKRAREVNNNCDIYYKLCFCNGGAHFARVTLNQHGSVSSHRAGTNCAKDQLTEPGHCQCQCQTNSDSTRALKVKTTGFESINNCNIHRRLSADSGRVTWSESGDSIISENQVGETSRQTSTAAAKTTVSTSQSQYVMSPVISTSVSASKENVYSKNAEYISLETDRYLQEDELHHFHTRDIPCHSRSNQPGRRFRSHVDSNAGQRFSGAHPRHDSWEENRVPRFSETEVPTLEFISESKHIVMESDRSAENKSNVKLIASQASPVGPRRSASDWAIRKACKTGAKSTRSQLDSLTERDAIIQQTEARPPPRPRSKSLFVDVGSRGGNQSLLLSKKKSQTSSIRLDQVSKADFTKWIHVSRAWEMGVDSQDNRGIKAYGIVAVPSVHGLALTDGAKVKIKIYKANGEMKHSFGAPTWPRFGRGICLSPSGRQLVVCHLFEVCSYTLEGDLIDRYTHENMRTCWGIACDPEGNYVVTDPQTSSVFLLTPTGEVTKLIGESNPIPTSRSRKHSSRSSSRKKNPIYKSQSTGKLKTLTDTGKNVAEVGRSSTAGAAQITSRKSSLPEEGDFNKKARLLTPRYVAVNSKNQILITDTKQRCLLVMKKDGTQLFSVGGGRAGCSKCAQGKGEMLANPQAVTGDDDRPTAPIMTPTSNAVASGKASDPILGKPKARPSEPSLSYLAELCGSAPTCASKSGKPKQIGAIYRAHLARGESAESQAYEAAPRHQQDSKKGDYDIPNTSTASSHAIASRLSAHSRRAPEQCSSCTDLPAIQQDENRRQSSSKSMLKLFPKSIGRSSWWKGKNRKKLQIPPSEIGRCESLTSLSCGASVCGAGTKHPEEDSSDLSCSSLSPTSKSAQTPDKKTNAFLYVSEKSLTSPHGVSESSIPSLPISPTANVHAGEVFARSESGDSFPEVEEEPDSDEDEERTACRRCYVEDPRGICLDANDNILLVDRARHRVSVFNPEGHFIRHLLTQSDGLYEPTAICVVGARTIAVSNTSTSVKLFQFANEIC